MKLYPIQFDSCPKNLAFEEWYFNHFTEETLRLWTNPTSVVVGKHQNALAESNLSFCVAHDIPIVRRISGGGTVFHDEGNVNFSFFRWVDKNKMIDYDRSLVMVHKALTSLGYPVEMNKRHDLFLGEKKVSGNAQHLRKGRSLHHGTILYDANLDHLRDAIKRQSGSFVDKAVKSVRSPITNLRDYLDLGTTDDFKQRLEEEFIAQDLVYADDNTYEVSSINALVNDRYSKDEWNFGYSPSYQYKNTSGKVSVKLKVARGGTIESAEIYYANERQERIEQSMVNQTHFYSTLKDQLNQFKSIDVDQYLSSLF